MIGGLPVRFSRLIPCHSGSTANDRRMNRQIRYESLRTVRRPETEAGYVRQRGVVGCRHRWNGINFLGTVGSSQQAVAAVVKLRTLFEVVRPISGVDGGTGCSVGFNGVLIDRRIDHAQIVQNSAGLRAFARPEEPRNRNGCE